jgi:hypothetical protein
MRRSLRSPSKLLDPAILEEAARQVIDHARRHRIRIALVGGLALQHYGSQRLTGDVDVVTSSGLPGTLPLRLLTFGGESIRAPNGVPVCIIRRKDGYRRLYAAALANKTQLHGLPIVPLEYIAAMKLVAGRTKDMVDLEFMIASERLSLPKARQIIHKYVGGTFAVDSFDAIVMETQWKMKAGKL